MRLALKLHPDSLCAAVTRIEVEVARPRARTLALSYVVTGDIGNLLLPAATASARADELWKHTCFEAFVRAPPGPGYSELNFSPSTQWAIYRFGAYREGMDVARDMPAPRIDVESGEACFELRAAVELPGEGVWQLGLSAVIEEGNGRKSYWALAHPRGKPDFHHADCFALELEPP